MITESFILFHKSLRDLHQRQTGVMTPIVDVLRMPVATLVKRMKDGILHTVEFERYSRNRLHKEKLSLVPQCLIKQFQMDSVGRFIGFVI